MSGYKARLVAKIGILCAALYVNSGACSEESIPVVVENEVKAGVEKAVEIAVCSDRTLTTFLEIDTHECRNRLAKIYPVCWIALDKIVPKYSVNADESGKEWFLDLVHVYVFCAKSELLTPDLGMKTHKSIRD